MNQRPILDVAEPFAVKNSPLRPRERAELLSRPGTYSIEGDDGEVILAPDYGQQRLWWAFRSPEDMRRDFPRMWPEVVKHIDRDTVDYVAMDLSGLATRQWLEPLLQDADFKFFAEWMDMSNPDITSAPIPEFPDGLTMRRATDDDLDRCESIWLAAYGDLTDGVQTFEWMAQEATWVGVLEDQTGNVVAFAMDGEVERAEGQVLAATVAPEAWGNGYGELVLGAAVYALAAQDAVRATIRVRPDITQGLRICSAAGFRHQRAGLEYRRDVDEEAIAARREARRIAGVKARFGRWR